MLYITTIEKKQIDNSLGCWLFCRSLFGWIFDLSM